MITMGYITAGIMSYVVGSIPLDMIGLSRGIDIRNSG